MADITEQQEVAQEISDAISRPVGFGEDYDEVGGLEIQIISDYSQLLQIISHKADYCRLLQTNHCSTTDQMKL